ncbi:hypothetical protein JG491_18330 [Streptomyces sp. CRPSP2-6A1]|nr:hypothetical protein [Streptomyces sp. CRPSP2-6A1]
MESLLRLLLPASGRRRSCGPPLARQDTVAVGLPRGEDVGLVRPYLVAHERRQEERRQRARRRVLWLAVSGVDIGPRVIRGVEVTAR